MRSWWIPILAAVTVALAVILFRAYSSEEAHIGGAGWIDQSRFERDLRSPPVMGKAHAKNVVVRLDLDVDIVDFDELDLTTLTYRQVKFASPRIARDSQGSSAREHLDSLTQFLDASPVRTTYRINSQRSQQAITFFAAVLAAIVSAIAVRVLITTRKQPVHVVESQATDYEPIAPIAEPNEITREAVELIAADSDAEQNAVVLETTPILAVEQAPVPPRAETEKDREYAGEYYPVARTPRGFSIVEIAVVLAVLTILVAFLLPAATAARRQAQTLQCATQLRQIGDAFHIYANNNGGWLPAYSGWHTWPRGLPEDESGPAWTIELSPYLQPPDGLIYICPSLPPPYHFRSYFLAARWSSTMHHQAMKLSDVKRSGQFILAGDKTQLHLYPKLFGTSAHRSDDADPDDAGDGGGDPILAWPWQHGGFYMHRRGNNVLFDDGHVATVARFDPTSMTFNPHRVEDWSEVTPN